MRQNNMKNSITNLRLRIKASKKELQWLVAGLLIGLLITPIFQLLALIFQSFGLKATSIISTVAAIIIAALVPFVVILRNENAYLRKLIKEYDPNIDIDSWQTFETAFNEFAEKRDKAS
jgi:predicted PurR-regulated permease PerM